MDREQDAIVPGQYIVVLKDSVDHPGAVAESQTERHRGRLGFVYRHALEGYSAKLSDAAVEALRQNPNVKYVSPVHKYEATAQTTPAGVKRIGAATNPALDIDGTDDVRVDADVAVIDTGIDFTHPDLDVAGRTNCVPPSESESEWYVEQCIDNAGTDGDGHGTHVAGTVGAIDNGIGVVGVAPGARLWAVRVLNNVGGGYDPWIIAGIDWVTAHSSQIEVANMSLVGPGRSRPTEEAIDGAVSAGVVVVVAAGNEGRNALHENPANVPAAITVSAMVDTDGIPGGKGTSCKGKDDSFVKTVNWGSNWGSGVDIAAPGACVYSTLPLAGSNYGASSYGSLSGTSMATPHVAGAAAVLAAESNPGSKADVEAIRNQLVAGGSLDWTDSSEDGAYEPLVNIGGTPLSAPEVTTGGWESTEVGGATVTGALNARGLEAKKYEFEYGLTASYGAIASASQQSVAGSYMAVKAKLQGLEPGRTYHYRLALTTPQGTIYGADRTLAPSRWASQAAFNGPTADDEQLMGVSCPTDGWCMGVDWRYISEGNGQQLGSYVFNGSQWSFVQMPTPSGGSYPQINSVSCTSTSNCIAVGRVWFGSVVVPLVEKWNGTSWEVKSVPAPPTEAAVPYAQLDAVSCASSAECMAVGYFKVSGSGANAVWQVHVARLKGGSWTNMFPLPPNVGEMLAVSCPSTSFCAATGIGDSLIWDGSSWSARPQAVNARFSGVSCTSQSFCLAVSPEPHAQVWNGTQWSAIGRQETDLYGVDCLSPEHCIAAGVRYGAGLYPVVERWDGSTLTSQATLRENERFAYFWDVDCTPTSGCAAVGGAEGELREPLIAMAPEWRPGVATETPQASPDDANLRGTVDPNGLATSYRFEWGATSSYGNVVPVPDKAVGSGSSPVKVVQKVSGLKASTTYHYRLVATNPEGVSASPDGAFTTPNLEPVFSKAVGTAGSGNGQFNGGFGVAVSPVDGTVAVADSANNRIQIFSEEGTYVRQFGSVGSGNGQFKEPYGVAFDSQGDVWVADTLNSRIQELTATGQFIQKFGTEGSADGALNKPFGITVDGSGTVWVADTYNKRVQAFSATGTYIKKISIGVYTYGVALDSGGDIWSSASDNKLREHSSAGTLLRTVGSAGSGNGQLSSPRGIAVDGKGNVWVADAVNNRVQVFGPTGEYLTKFGSLGGGNGQFSFPAAVALDPRGSVWITDMNNSRLQRWTGFTPWPPVFSKAVGTAGSGNGQFNGGFGVAVSPVDGTVAVADSANNRIQIFSEEGTYVRQFGSVGSGNGQFKEPYGVAFDSQGDVWVADTLNSRIQELTATGQFIQKFGTEGSADGALNKPFGITVDGSGTVWVADTYNKRVQAFSATGTYIKKISIGVYTYGVALDSGGDIWSSASDNKLREHSSAGTLLRTVGSAGSGNGQLSSPRGIAVDGKGNVWVADAVNNRVQVFGPTGEYLTKFGSLGGGTGQFSFPAAVALDPRGSVWITDMNNSRLQRWTGWP